MKRILIAATAVAMFFGTSSFAGNKTAATKAVEHTAIAPSANANVLHSGKTGKAPKKRHTKHARRNKKAADATSQSPSKK